MFNYIKKKRPNRSIQYFFRKTQFQLKNITNCVATGMVLFLAFIAVILYLNSRDKADQEVHNIISSLTTSLTTNTISPSPSTSAISVIDTTVAFPPCEPVITPIQVESSISTTDNISLPSSGPVNLQKPLSSPVPTIAAPTPKPVPSPAEVAKPELVSSPVSTVTPTLEPVSSPVPTVTPIPKPVSTPVPTVAPTPKPSPQPQIMPSPFPTATRTPSAAPLLIASSQKMVETKVLVVIDPGHGGIDPGACSIYEKELYEKDINLDISLKLRTLLENSYISVLMTRETDTEVYQSTKYNHNENILERPRIANNNNATLFVSIHANAYDIKLPGAEKCNGTEIYHAGKTHGDITTKQFAEMMGKAIDLKTDTKYNGIIQKAFGVLRLSNMPALLIETAYLTNKGDHKRLLSNEFRIAMAEGIYNGIVEMLKAMGAYEKNEAWYICTGDEK